MLAPTLPLTLPLTHSLSLVLVAVMKSKELKTKTSHAHTLNLSLPLTLTPTLLRISLLLSFSLALSLPALNAVVLAGDIGSQLTTAADACDQLQLDLQATGESHTAARVQNLCSHLEEVVGRSGTGSLHSEFDAADQLNAASNEADLLIQELNDAGKGVQSIALEEATSTLRKAYNIILQANAIRGKVVQAQAEVDLCLACTEATDEADAASVALMASGTDVQRVQLLAASVGDLSSTSFEDVEAAVASVETLELDLTRQNKTQDAKTLRKVVAKANVALSKKMKGEDAKLSEEARCFMAGAEDICQQLHQKLELVDDHETAAQISELESRLKSSSDTLAGLKAAGGEMEVAARRLRARGNDVMAASLQVACPLFDYLTVLAFDCLTATISF